MLEPPKRGVGLVYSPLLHQVFLENADLIDVAEIEPQTAWTADHPIDGPFHQVASVAELWRSLPQHKLLHSVGMPLAGLRPPSPHQTALLADLAREFDCAYVSEHLSVGGTPHQNAGFLLPPRQSRAGVEIAARNILALQDGLGRPVAVETGVSYLPAYHGEIPDGDYVRAVAEAADCGILFDIHNAYCNQRNGRHRLADFAAALPVDRVWELHVAGGFERDGYWLDAHSGEPPADLIAAAREIVRGLPNLGAIIFEIYPSFLDAESGPMLARSLGILRDLWSDAGKARGDGDMRHLAQLVPDGPEGDDLATWEGDLTRAVHLQLPVSFGDDLSYRPSLTLYHDLAHSFRASSLLRLLPRSLQLIAASGFDLEATILRFEAATPPPLFALSEAEAFRAWADRQQGLPATLAALCDYEVALLRVPLTGQPVVVSFDGDPQPLFQSLADQTPPPGTLLGPPWEIEIVPSAQEAQTTSLAS